MKKNVVFFAVLITITLTVCGTNPDKNSDASDTPPQVLNPAGAYTEDRALTDEDHAVLSKVLEGLMGVRYEPVSVATQVVAGINYRFTATATPVVPNAVSYSVHIFVFRSLSGEVELTGIVRL